MLIQIDPSIRRYFISHDELTITSKLVRNIDKIAESVFDQFHILTTDYDTIQFFKEYQTTAPRTRLIFMLLSSKYYELNSYEKLFKRKVIIHLKDDNPQNTSYEYYLRLDAFDSILRSIIVSENLSDVDFYCKIASYKHDFNLHKINVSKGHVGGSTGYVSIPNILNDNIFCFCIFDTDKSHLFDSPKESYKQAKKAIDENSEKPCVLFEMNLREKENWLPLEVYQLINKDDTKNALLKTLVSMSKNSKYHRFLSYLDLKDGITYEKANMLIKSCQYTKGIFKLLHRIKIVNLEPIYKSSFSNDEYIIPGFGDSVVDIFTTEYFDGELLKRIANTDLRGLYESSMKIRIKKDFYDKIINKLPPYLENEWNRVYKEISNWGCSYTDNFLKKNI